MTEHDSHLGARHIDARRRVAVVGSGVAGLTAAYLLQRRYDVTLFEADQRLGGHAHTHDLLDRDGRPQSVDTGFIVHNRRTYPNLLRLFAELDVPTKESEMSMSVACAGCGLEYAGARGLTGVFPTLATLARPRYLRMLLEVKKFHRHAHRVLAANPETTDGAEAAATAPDELTLREFLTEGGYSDYFIAHFILPVVSCVWSCGADVAGEYPARYLFRFLDNHGLLSVTGSPAWRTVDGGSRTYVERTVKQLSAVLTGVPVRSVRRIEGGGAILRTADDDVSHFDMVVLATHPAHALALLEDPTPAEASTLGAFEYSPATTLLHSDTALLPANPRAAASWNYRMNDCAGADEKVHVTYDMNRLQRLDSGTRYLVTLNSQDQIDPATVIDTMQYEHPIYTPKSVAAQALLPSLNTDTTAFAGAYHGWGFHEDGCASGVRAAEALGVTW